MDFSYFYKLTTDVKGRPFEVDTGALSTAEQLAIFDGVNTAPNPARLRVVKGQQAADFLDCPSGYLRIFSQSFFDILERENFSGWQSYPVTLDGTKEDKFQEGYRGLIVKGRSGPLDEKLAVMASELPNSPRGRPIPALFGWGFDAKTWDGTDIFHPVETLGTIFVHRRVRDALIDANLKNIRLDRLDLVKWPWSRGRATVSSLM